MRNAQHDNLVAHQTRESIMTRMESFGDAFERAATTAQQDVIAERYKDDVHDFAESGPVTAADLEQLGKWLKHYGDQFAQLVTTPEQKMLAVSFEEFVADVASPEIKEALHRPLVNELVEEITSVMANGRSNGIPFASLSRAEQTEFLEMIIDWTDYINRGLDLEPDAAEHIRCITDNALSGKPCEQWMGRTDPLALSLDDLRHHRSDQAAKTPEKTTDRDIER
jgi:hypothetical protein